MNKYTYEYFLRSYNFERSLKDILNISGDFSNIPVEKIFSEKRNHLENRAFKAFCRITNSRGDRIVSLEELLNVTFRHFYSARNMGERSQIIVIESLLKYFNLGEIVSKAEAKDDNKLTLNRLIENLDEAALREILNTIFDELTPLQQTSALTKITGINE